MKSSKYRARKLPKPARPSATVRPRHQVTRLSVAAVQVLERAGFDADAALEAEFGAGSAGPGDGSAWAMMELMFRAEAQARREMPGITSRDGRGCVEFVYDGAVLRPASVNGVPVDVLVADGLLS